MSTLHKSSTDLHWIWLVFAHSWQSCKPEFISKRLNGSSLFLTYSLLSLAETRGTFRCNLSQILVLRTSLVWRGFYHPSRRAVKLKFHGTDTDADTDTDFRDAPIVQFCKRVHDCLSCTMHVHVYTGASPTDILAMKSAHRTKEDLPKDWLGWKHFHI